MQAELVDRARRGDREAFGVLAAGAVDRLYAIARLALRDTELAEDATQEALVRAWRDLPTLRDVERFDAWLDRLLVNACLDIMRRRRRRAVEVELTPIFTPITADFTSSVVDRDLLDRGLRALEPGWRAIVVLHYFLGMPLPDVASALGIPLGTAKSRLHRSIGVLRATVEGDGPANTAAVPEGRLA